MSGPWSECRLEEMFCVPNGVAQFLRHDGRHVAPGYFFARCLKDLYRRMMSKGPVRAGCRVEKTPSSHHRTSSVASHERSIWLGGDAGAWTCIYTGGGKDNDDGKRTR